MKTKHPAKGLPRKEILLIGSVIKNPVLVQAIGLCPVVAIATSLKFALVLSLVSSAVLFVAEFATAVFIKRFPRWLRIGFYLLIGIAVVVPAMYMVQQYFPSAMLGLGIYLPLIATNSIVVLHCERFAIKIRVRTAFYDALASSLGYSAVMIFCGIVRELIGYGSIFGYQVHHHAVASGMLMPFGGFLIIGFAAAGLKWFIDQRYPEYAEETMVDKKKISLEPVEEITVVSKEGAKQAEQSKAVSETENQELQAEPAEQAEPMQGEHPDNRPSEREVVILQKEKVFVDTIIVNDGRTDTDQATLEAEIKAEQTPNTMTDQDVVEVAEEYTSEANIEKDTSEIEQDEQTPIKPKKEPKKKKELFGKTKGSKKSSKRAEKNDKSINMYRERIQSVGEEMDELDELTKILQEINSSANDITLESHTEREEAVEE